jgi:hypothetical protein
MPKLERTLRHFAKDFGETSAQAVVRWSVQTCRELAVETQAWGKSGTKKKQIDAIISDAYHVMLVAETAKKTPKGYRCTNSSGTFYTSDRKFLNDAAGVNNWIELNRTRRRARTAHLSPQDRMVCTRRVFNQAIKLRSKRAGMAKGGWLVAGQEIARAQVGQDKIAIGKNFLGYAQKAGAGFGSARKPESGFNPAAFVTNKVSHVSSSHVMKPSAYDKALGFGLKKTLNWYRKAVNALDKKK